MTEIAGDFAGLPVVEARAAIVKELKNLELLRGSNSLKQAVGVHERCSTPIEFHVSPQWFMKLLDKKKELLKRGNELNWYPGKMKIRYEDWAKNLKWDWNISRQRVYGVPFPLWYCEECSYVVTADEATLPVDPTETSAPYSSCPKCSGSSFVPEKDVMDTWMTSSLTPLINSDWATPEKGRMDMIYPMTVRVQGFEIIRTWLFYTVAKSHVHTDSLPWNDVMISGWGLTEQGKKISKRDLDKAADKDGFNRYEPYQVIKKYGADSLRYWATLSSLGNDLRYSEKDVKVGRKLLTKLWNASTLLIQHLMVMITGTTRFQPMNSGLLTGGFGIIVTELLMRLRRR